MSGTDNRQRTEQVGVRLLPDEARLLTVAAEQEGASPSELLRRAYFTDRAALVESIAQTLRHHVMGGDYCRLHPWESSDHEPWLTWAETPVDRAAPTSRRRAGGSSS